MDTPESIETARKDLEKAQNGLLKAYLSTISTSYEKGRANTRELILKGLEGLVNSLLIKSDYKDEPVFNYVVAKELRTEQKLSQRRLAELIIKNAGKSIGIKESSLAQLIHSYEMGHAIPSSKTASSEAYLTWVSEELSKRKT